MAQAMGSTAQVMAATNKQLKVEDIQRTMMSFEQESTKMDMAGEMSKDIVIMKIASVAYSCNIRMDPSSLYYYLHPSHTPSPFPSHTPPPSPPSFPHTVDDTLDSLFDDDEQEEDAVMSQILDEIGIEVNKKVRVIS